MKSTDICAQNIEYLIMKSGGQEQFAEALEVDTSTVTRNKHPDNISQNFLDRIEKYFGYDKEDMFTKPLKDIDKEIRGEYYAYFFTNNIDSEGDILIDTAIIKIDKNKVDFTITLNAVPSKKLTGKVSVFNNLIYFNLGGVYEDTPIKLFLTLPYYRISRAYIGGLGYIMLPSEGATLPCVQKVVLSNVPFTLNTNTEGDYQFLCEKLILNNNSHYQKITFDEDRAVYRHISELNIKKNKHL